MNGSTLCIDVAFSSECVQIKSPKILEFYNSNPSINFEKINLLVLEMLQCRASAGLDFDPNFSDFLRPEEKHKTSELETFFKKIREAVHVQIQKVLRESAEIKTEYIHTFRSLQMSDSIKMKEANNRFSEGMKQCLSTALKLRNSGIADRTGAMLRQFHKILNTNVDSFLTSASTSDSLSEYVSNFDLNTSHMINAVCGLLTEFIAAKEKQTHPILESFRKREDASTAYYKLIYELNDFLQQFDGDDKPNKSFEVVLSKIFPTASITSDSESNNNTIVREDKPNIFIEMHSNKDRNIGMQEVKAFLKTATDKNVASILVSNYTGISSKSDYQIEIHNNRVILYLHRLDANSEKLQIAVDMIDSLSAKLDEFCVNAEHKYSIPKDVLDDVNREYQQFIIQKEAIIGVLKDQHKRVLSQLEEIRFLSLDRFLSTRYSSCKKQGFVCDLCHVFNVPTLKGLAAHKRGCARKRTSLALDPDVIVK